MAQLSPWIKSHLFSLDSIFVGVFIILASCLYFAGLAKVPFHPDESTQIFMSADIDYLISNPATLLWKPDITNDVRQNYRELDSPLTRYLIGIGREIAGLPAVPQDWNWSKSWEENAASGALPSDQLLLVSRVSVSIWFPFSLLFLYGIGKKVSGKTMGWAAMLLFATNALILLHTRRAMAESSLVFFIIFSLWSILVVDKSKWLCAFSIALAFNAKYSAIFLVPLALIFIVIPGNKTDIKWRSIVVQLLTFMAVFGLVTVLLNPFLWSAPVRALTEAWNARQTLLQNQVTMAQSVTPGRPVFSFEDRFLSMLANVYYVQPAVADVGNYLNATAVATQAYFANPLNDLFHDVVTGSLSLMLSILGIVLAIYQVAREKFQGTKPLWILLLGSVLAFLFIMLFIPIPYQRYYIILIPFVILWQAYAIAGLIEKLLPIHN
jgi:4-amino-4-deoxy-L-arabinose transferase-like glycosyltransferase